MAKAEAGKHGENKTERISALVTPTAKGNLNQLASDQGISLGELLERVARGQVPLELLEEAQKQSLGESLPR